uniref:Uncharacterized protein n=1 Tax=Acrobeloides nanus TaxID=290746 RepID=A0A914CLV4_9BILA
MFVIIGVIVKKYTFVIPYFTLCTLLIFVLMVKLFSDLISTANSKDTLEYNRLKILLLQSALLLLEVYTVIIVWRAFNYITDYIVHKDMFKKPPVGIRDPDVELELLSRTLPNGNIEIENGIPLRVLNSKTNESVHIPKVEKLGH